MDPLILVANPGSASRKYALYQGSKRLLKIHFEYAHDQLIYTVSSKDQVYEPRPGGISNLAFAATKILKILREHIGLTSDSAIKTIALRVVAPSPFFQEHRLLDKTALNKLEELEPRALLHINATLQEVHQLRRVFPDVVLVGLSDSAFHAAKPAYAQKYGLPVEDQDRLELQRYGYHGLSVESVVGQLSSAGKLPKRLIVCHLGSGASVTAIKNGKSLDNTMGYSPLEGLIMATRSGSVDITATQVLQAGLGMSNQKLQDYLNNKSGLLGLSGQSSDIRELLTLEAKGNERAKLALDAYVYRVQLAIGSMAGALGGVDSLVFTGTVGERSAAIRRRIVKRLLFLGLSLEPQTNHGELPSHAISMLSPSSHPAKIYVVPADEDIVMATHARQLVA